MERASWTSEQVEALLDIIIQNMGKNKTFMWKWEDVLPQFQEATGASYTKIQLVNKVDSLRRQFNNLQNILEIPGVLDNKNRDKNENAISDVSVWNKVVKLCPEAKNILPHFHLLDIGFCKDENRIIEYCNDSNARILNNCDDDDDAIADTSSDISEDQDSSSDYSHDDYSEVQAYEDKTTQEDGESSYSNAIVPFVAAVAVAARGSGKISDAFALANANANIAQPTRTTGQKRTLMSTLNSYLSSEMDEKRIRKSAESLVLQNYRHMVPDIIDIVRVFKFFSTHPVEAQMFVEWTNEIERLQLLTYIIEQPEIFDAK